MDYISREKTLKNLEEILNDENCPIFIAAAITQIISEQPSEDVVPIVHGKRIKTKKHNWKKDINGKVDFYAWDYGICNGPQCLDCGKHFCIHCIEMFGGKEAVKKRLEEETCCERTVCDVCGENISKDSKYCKHCGAKMDLE